MKNNRILPVFISFAGCTYRCVYCNQHSITGVKPKSVSVSAKEQIKTALSYNIPYDEFAYYGGSFSCLPDNIRTELYSIAHETGISKLRFSTSPDCINQKIIDEAVHNNVEVIELGVQSLSNSVLKLNKRPYDCDKCINSIKLIKDNIKNTGIQIMVGMYGETAENFSETVDKLIKLKPDYVRIYPTVVLEDTELASLYREGVYKPLSLWESVARAAYAYILFEAEGSNVIRVGLHDSEGVKSSAIAGAYHPSMGDMVKTVTLMIYYNSGFGLKIDKKYLNVAYGFKSALKDRAKVEIVDNIEPDFRNICRILKENAGEDYKRKIQEQTNYFSERLIRQTNNG